MYAWLYAYILNKCILYVYTQSTYVKSCNMTLAGLKGISTLFSCFFSQSNILYTSCDLTWNPSQFLTAASNKTLIENGKRPGYEDMYMIWYDVRMRIRVCFEAWAKLAQQWLPLRIHLELINKDLMMLVIFISNCAIWSKERTVQCQIWSSFG